MGKFKMVDIPGLEIGAKFVDQLVVTPNVQSASSQIQVKVGTDEKGNVVIDFLTPVQRIAFPQLDAINLGRTILQHAGVDVRFNSPEKKLDG